MTIVPASYCVFRATLGLSKIFFCRSKIEVSWGPYYGGLLDPRTLITSCRKKIASNLPLKGFNHVQYSRLIFALLNSHLVTSGILEVGHVPLHPSLPPSL